MIHSKNKVEKQHFYQYFKLHFFLKQQSIVPNLLSSFKPYQDRSCTRVRIQGEIMNLDIMKISIFRPFRQGAKKEVFQLGAFNNYINKFLLQYLKWFKN